MVASQVTPSKPSGYISEATVLAALDGLISGSRSQLSNPLESLVLVEEVLMDASMPASKSIRSYGLAEVLISLISEELAKYRCAVGMPHVEDIRTRRDAQEVIACDASTGNAELIGWSWLYFHYVRVEFDITCNLFCLAAYIDQRTLRRYRGQAVHRLVFRLIDREREARNRHRQRFLLAQIPSVLLPYLYGRESHLKTLHQLARCLDAGFIQIVGQSGVGKTVLVQSVVRSLIAENSFDDVIWLEASTSIDDIIQSLKSFLRESELHGSLRDVLQCRRVVFVIDGIDQLGHEPECFERLLSDLHGASIFLTSRTPFPMRNVRSYVVLSELSENDAKRMIRSCLDRWHVQQSDSPVEEDIHALWEHTGGNPHQIEQAVIAYRMRQMCL